MAALVLTDVAQQQHRDVIEGSTYVARILDVVLRIVEDRLFFLDVDHLPVVPGHPIVLLAAVRTLRGGLRPELNTLETEQMGARQACRLLRGRIQTYRADCFVQHHQLPLLELRDGGRSHRCCRRSLPLWTPPIRLIFLPTVLSDRTLSLR